GQAGFEDRVDQRDVAPADGAVDLGLLASLDAVGELPVLGRDDLRIDLDEGEIVAPDALATKKLGGEWVELVARRVLEYTLVGDRDAAVEVELERTAVPVARRGERALAPVDVPAVLAATVAGEVEDELADRAALIAQVREDRVLASRLDPVREVHGPLR